LTEEVNRLLVPTAALLWGLQAAFLSPALALILVSLFGWVARCCTRTCGTPAAPRPTS
jgi:hypothetical protein